MRAVLDSARVSLDVRYLGLGGDLVDYRDGWDLQHRLHAEVVAGDGARTRCCCSSTRPSTPPASGPSRTSGPLDGTPVIDVDRGGKITWHGPGQLVGYPLVRLPEAFGVVDYVRRLEQALIDALAELGLTTGRVPGRSGRLAGRRRAGRPERKIAAIGVRVAGGVTMHGFAVNADPDLAAFDRIVPCGIADAGVTSIAAELGTLARADLARVRARAAPRAPARLRAVRAHPDVAALPEPVAGPRPASRTGSPSPSALTARRLPGPTPASTDHGLTGAPAGGRQRPRVPAGWDRSRR